MAGKRQRKNGTWEYCFQQKGVLPERVYFTFDSEEEGDTYVERVEPLLRRGVVPKEMLGGSIRTFEALLEAYEVQSTLVKSEIELLPVVTKLVGKTPIELLSHAWVDTWVGSMKDAGLAPGTIQKRVGLLARAVDWGIRKEHITLPNNPLRMLPRGFITKGVAKEKLWAGERDRRLEGTEEGAIRSVLADKYEALLFDMALETAMRLKEMHTLTVGQIDLGKRTIFLVKTKNGSKRQVPISSVLAKILPPFLEGREQEDSLFPFRGEKESPEQVTNRLSTRFGARFAKAGCPDLRFHDLRHEATARLYERTTMSDMEIASVTGHKDLRMLKRYANLRASALVGKMW
jgi:integrase